MRLRHSIYICALTGCALAGCVSAPVVNKDFSAAYSLAMPVCDLLSHPRSLVGHRVTVGGLYANAPHGRVLYDQSCPSRELGIQIVDSQESLKVDRKMQRLLEHNRTVGIRSVYSGVISSTPVIGGCSDDTCFAFAIV